MMHSVSHRLIKWALQAQVAMLRRQWAGPLNRSVLVITTTGRRSGKQHATPIGFAQEGEDLLAFNLDGKANWYRNVLANPHVTLEQQGRVIPARGEPITDRNDLQRVIDTYKRQRPEVFRRFFKVALDDSTDDILKQIEGRIVFVRFHRVQAEAMATTESHPFVSALSTPRWRWYHGIALYLLVQMVGFILGNLVSAARRGPRQSPQVWQAYFRELNQAAFAPPAEAFVPVWAINNTAAIWGLLRALNKPADTPGRTAFLRLQALSWLDLAIWNASYFAMRSPINGFVLTASFLLMTIASIGIAALRLRDTRIAFSLATLCAWLLLATPIAWLQMRWNRDDLWQVGPWANPRRAWVKRGTGQRQHEG